MERALILSDACTYTRAGAHLTNYILETSVVVVVVVAEFLVDGSRTSRESIRVQMNDITYD